MKQSVISTFLIVYCLLAFTACKKDQDGPAPQLISISPQQDGPGAEVTISGKYFGVDKSAIQVAFNGIPAIVSDFDTTGIIYARVPDGNAGGIISITVNGVKVNSLQSFTVLKGHWTVLPDSLPHNQQAASVFSVNGKGYIVGGSYYNYTASPYYVSLKDVYEFDPGSEKLTRKSDFPGEARSFACVFVVNNKAYLSCGLGQDVATHTITYYNELWEYDPTSDGWLKKADYPGVGRVGLFSFAVGSKGYAGTGQTDGSGDLASSDFWEYNPASDSWTQKADFGGGSTSFGTGAATSNDGYAGLCYSSGSSIKSSWWRYYPAGNEWSQQANMLTAQEENSIEFLSPAATFIIQDKIYAVTGGMAGCYEYSEASNSWTRRTSFPERRRGAGGFSIGNNAYLTGGVALTRDGRENSQWEKGDIWKFDAN